MRFRRIPGVPHGTFSTTFTHPSHQPPDGWPGAREPGARVRIVPNETLLPGPLGAHLGELTQRIIEEGADLGVSVEIDTSDRIRPREQRGGAQGIEAIDLLVSGAAGAGGAFLARQLGRLGDRIFDAAVDWALRHRSKQPPQDDPISVCLYGPKGELLKNVLVPQGRGDAPPYDPNEVLETEDK